MSVLASAQRGATPHAEQAPGAGAGAAARTRPLLSREWTRREALNAAMTSAGAALGPRAIAARHLQKREEQQMPTPSHRRPNALIVIPALTALVLGPAVALAPHVAAASAPPSLQQAFDNVGITTASDASTGNFDGIGDSFSASSLANDALVPGTTLLHDGTQLAWPDVAPGTPDNVVADGQKVSFGGQGSVLGIVGASAYGSASGTFTVTYTDGTSTSADVTLSDWVDESPAPGTDFIATTGGWDPGGTVPVSLSYATVPIDPSKEVASVTFPTVSTGVGQGVNSMHVFDLVVGTPGAQASGAPGAASYYDEARKDCVGTAADTASKVWYTVADGTLSDTYAPTIDNTNVKSLDPIVTGPGFTALQPRDMTYSVSELGATGMACRVVALDPAEHFALVSDFITNPFTESVVIQFSLVSLPGAPSGLHVYLRFNPLLNGHGGGGTGNAGAESATIAQTFRGPVPLSYSTNSFSEATNRNYASPIYAALAASRPFSAVETGFVGTPSDGLNELDAAQVLSTTAPDADNGNVVQTAELSLGSGPAPVRPTPLFPPAPPAQVPPGGLGSYGDLANFGQQPPGSCGQRTAPGASGASWLPQDGFASISPAGIAAAAASAAGLGAPLPASAVASQTVALGFGDDEQDALNAALSSSAVPFASTFAFYQAQWAAYDLHLCSPPVSLAAAGQPAPAAGGSAAGGSAAGGRAPGDPTAVERARTGSPRTCSRRARTRPSSGPPLPLCPARGARPCRRASPALTTSPPTSAPTGRCSLATPTRPSLASLQTATCALPSKWSTTSSTTCSSPTVRSRATGY